MPYTLFGESTPDPELMERTIDGVAIAVVESNKDLRGEGRVKVSYPWAPGIEPWARVVTPYAGMNRGIYFMPQDGDEVLVAFQNGDINVPMVIGSIWSSLDRPPISPGDILAPSTKRIIRTGNVAAHEIVLDDLDSSVTITSITKQSITMDPTQIKLSTTKDTASITLDTLGNITIKGALSITLQAESITLDGSTVNVTSKAATSIKAGGDCSVQGSMVRIN